MFRPLLQVEKTGVPSLSGSELALINPLKPPVIGSIRGYRYLLKQPGTTDRFCIGLEVFDDELLSSYEGGLVPYNFDYLKYWLVTLVTPDSKVLCHQAPARAFLANTEGNVNYRRWFAPGRLFDPRQSFVECTTEIGLANKAFVYQLNFQ